MSTGGLTAALAGLGVPPVVWIILLVISVLLGVIAAVRWWEERGAVEAPLPPPARDPAAPPSAEKEWSPPRMVTAPQGGALRDAMKRAEEVRRAASPTTSYEKPPPVARGPENQPSPASSEEAAEKRKAVSGAEKRLVEARLSAEERALAERKALFEQQHSRGRRILDLHNAGFLSASWGDRFDIRKRFFEWTENVVQLLEQQAASQVAFFEKDPPSAPVPKNLLAAGLAKQQQETQMMEQRLARLRRIIDQL